MNMNKPWIHEDCLELVANLADMNCSASISDGVMTMEDGTQIDLRSTANKEWKSTRGTAFTSRLMEGIGLRRLKMSNHEDRYIYLWLDYGLDGSGTTISIKLDDESVIAEAWSGEDEFVAGTRKTYAEMGVEVRELLTIEKQQIDKKK